MCTGPVEAAGNGLRHQVACLYLCNRQVGPGEWASVVFIPFVCLLSDSPAVTVSAAYFCVSIVHAWPNKYTTLLHMHTCKAGMVQDIACIGLCLCKYFCSSAHTEKDVRNLSVLVTALRTREPVN